MQNKQPRLQIFLFPQQKKQEYQNTHAKNKNKTSSIQRLKKQAFVVRSQKQDFGPRRGKTKPKLRGRIETIW